MSAQQGTSAEWREFLKRPGALAECESPDWLLEGCPKCGAVKGFNVTSDCWAYCLGCGWGTSTTRPFTPAGMLTYDLLPQPANSSPAPEVLAKLAERERINARLAAHFCGGPAYGSSQAAEDIQRLLAALEAALTALAATKEERDRWKAAANWAKYHGRYLGWAVGEVHAYDDSHGGPYNAARVATVPHTDNREADDLEAMVRASQVPPGSEKVRKVADMLAEAYTQLAAATREAETLHKLLGAALAEMRCLGKELDRHDREKQCNVSTLLDSDLETEIVAALAPRSPEGEGR